MPFFADTTLRTISRTTHDHTWSDASSLARRPPSSGQIEPKRPNVAPLRSRRSRCHEAGGGIRSRPALARLSPADRATDRRREGRFPAGPVFSAPCVGSAPRGPLPVGPQRGSRFGSGWRCEAVPFRVQASFEPVRLARSCLAGGRDRQVVCPSGGRAYTLAGFPRRETWRPDHGLRRGYSTGNGKRSRNALAGSTTKPSGPKVTEHASKNPD